MEPSENGGFSSRVGHPWPSHPGWDGLMGWAARARSPFGDTDQDQCSRPWASLGAIPLRATGQ